MSLKPVELIIPELTKSVVKAAFPKGNAQLTMRVELSGYVLTYHHNGLFDLVNYQA